MTNLKKLTAILSDNKTMMFIECSEEFNDLLNNNNLEVSDPEKLFKKYWSLSVQNREIDNFDFEPLAAEFLIEKK